MSHISEQRDGHLEMHTGVQRDIVAAAWFVVKLLLFDVTYKVAQNASNVEAFWGLETGGR